jgi:hypothetical protein
MVGGPGIRSFFLFSLFRYFNTSFRYCYSATFLNIAISYSLSLLLSIQCCGPHNFEGLYRLETDPEPYLEPDQVPDPFPFPNVLIRIHLKGSNPDLTNNGQIRI